MDGVEILEDEEAGEPTEEEIIEYARFLDIDPETEPHLMWIAKEGVAAPVPEPWKACTEDDEVFYFNFETSESIWDHPCDSHYKKMLEEERKKYAEGQGTGNVGISGNSLPGGSQARENESRENAQARNSPDSDVENSKSFVSEAVDSDSEVASSQSRSPKGAIRVVASDSRGSLADDSRASAESKSFVSEAVSDSELSTPNRSPTSASNTVTETGNVQRSSPTNPVREPQLSPQDQAEMWRSMSGGDALSTPRSSRSSRSASSVNSRNPPNRETSRSPKSGRSSRSGSSGSRPADERLEDAPDSPRSSRNSFDDSPKSSRSADSREKDIVAPALDPSPKSSRSADSREKDIETKHNSSSHLDTAGVGSFSEHDIVAPTRDPSSESMEKKDDKSKAEVGQDEASNAKSGEMPKRVMASESLPQGSPKSSPQASPQGSDRPQPVLDHGGYSARSSNPSEISEDFHSDWGVLSPPFSARSGKTFGVDVQNSLEVSASVDTRSIDTEVNRSLGLLGQQDKLLERKEKVDRLLGRTPKTWHSLQEDVQVLKDALETIAFIRTKQKEYLKIVKLEV